MFCSAEPELVHINDNVTAAVPRHQLNGGRAIQITADEYFY